MRRLILFALALFAPAAFAASHADLAISLNLPLRLASSQPVISGGVYNNGPDVAENVTVVAATSNGGQFVIPIGTLPLRASQGFTLTLPSGDATLRVEAHVSSTTPDPDGANDTASGSVQVTSAPQLSFYLQSAPAEPGQPVVYEAALTNDGANDAAHVTFTFPLDGGWTFGTSLTPRMHCAATAQGAGCTIDTLVAGERLTARFTLLAPNHTEGEPSHFVPVAFTSDAGVFQPPQTYLFRSIFRHVTVTSTADDGEGSLRQAIVAANATPSGIGCKLDFDIPLSDGERVATIRPLTPLPALTANSLYIDGSTQRLKHGDTNPDGPEVEINGSSLDAGNGFDANDASGASFGYREFRELVVNGFPANGINLTSGPSNVTGCYVGTDPAGRTAVPNRGRGIVITSSATIRDNIISGNGRSGIYVPSGRGITIANNRIGVAAGSAFLPLGNGASGIYFGPGSSENSVTGNVIAFNRDAGIGLDSNVEDIEMSANANASNGGLPIDYGLDGVTPDKPVFGDLPPLPILTAAHFDPATGQTIVEVHTGLPFVSTPNRMEFFASESGEPRQAAKFLGSLSPGGGNNVDLRFVYDSDLRGRFITATFTAPSRYYPEILGFRTSEVSAPIAVEGEPAAPLSRLPHGADLALQFTSFASTQVSAGDTVNRYFSFTNQGPDEAHDVTLTIAIEGATAVRLNAGTGDATCSQQGNTRIVCTQPRLAVGATFSSSFDVQAPLTPGTMTLAASLTSATEEVDRSNNEAKVALAVIDTPNLSATAQFPGPTEPGGTALYSISVGNFGHLTVNDVTLTIPLRTGWTFAAASGEGWQCTSSAATVVCKRAELGDRATASLQLTLRAPADLRGQAADSSEIKLTASRPLAYVPTIVLTTQVVRVYQVTSTADSGPGTLRDAITLANTECQQPFGFGNGLSCKIAFNLPPPVPSAGYYSIRPQTPLPYLTSTLLIDGRTQTDATGDTNPLGPEVELDGSRTASGNGIVIHTGLGAGVRGLAINRFPENGVFLDTIAQSYVALRVIADCYIGTDATGRTAAPNGLRGIRVSVTPNYSAFVSITGNVISGNAHSGIFVDAGSDIWITGNRVGVTAGEEMAPLGNGASGIYLGGGQDIVVNQNVVAFSRDAGIGSDLTASYIDMQRNVLRANGGLGFDFGLDGVTPNDGATRSQYLPQFPILTNASWDAANGVTRIEGTVPASIYDTDRATVDVYRSSGIGSADEWLGVVVVEPSNQPRPFAFTVPRNLGESLVVATFTRAGFISSWTSELSAPIPVTP
jgi:uncharacterized repeat protein (TIGR01451 family)